MSHSSTPDPKTSLDDPTAIHLWGQVTRGFQATNRRLHAKLKATFDLNEAEVETLLALHARNDRRAPMNALARAAAFSTGGFTKIADKLSNRGLTIRTDCSEDRRVTYLELTANGAEKAAELATFAAAANREHFIDILGPERATLIAEAMTELYHANHNR